MSRAHARGPALLVLALAILGCGVGEGSGDVKGTLYVRDCLDATNFGALDMPAAYDLNPVFFAGEPIEDISGGQKANRLIIRLEQSGKRIELNDSLSFDVVQTFEVARCVRGRVMVDATGASKPDYDEAMCSWVTGLPRLRVGVDQPIHAALLPRATCHGKKWKEAGNVVGDAVSSDGAPSAWESWIEFEQFGNAGQNDLVPGLRGTLDVDFKLDYGQRLHARAFKITLQDDHVVQATKHGDPVPEAAIAGTLEGWFDFDLLRGQGAQVFP